MKITCLSFWLALACTSNDVLLTSATSHTNTAAFMATRPTSLVKSQWRLSPQQQELQQRQQRGTHFYSNFDPQQFRKDAQDLLSSSSSSSMNMSVVSPPEEPPTASASSSMPVLGEDGVYHIENKEQHINFMEANPQKLVVVKFFAPWCRACKGLEPKFLKMVHDAKYQDIPIVWADLSIQHNKEYVKELGVLALPSIQINAGSDGLVENFPCGPSKVPILKKKLHQLINDRVDSETLELATSASCNVMDVTAEDCETPPCDEHSIHKKKKTTTTTTVSKQESAPEFTVAGVTVTPAQMTYLRNDIPYFQDFTEDEFNTMLRKAKLVTFDSGSIIMRQGMPGHTFYVIESGEVEISVRTGLEDPMTTQPSYLGTVLNQLGPQNYFGERSMITGEPRAASIRASETTKCFAFELEDIPSSSILSGKTVYAGTKQVSEERIQQVNDKYGVDVYDLEAIIEESTTKRANVESQKRGSVFKPNTTFRPTFGDSTVTPTNTEEQEEAQPTTVPGASSSSPLGLTPAQADDVLPLLVKFQMIRHAARCFDYIMHTKPKWGDEGESRRRQMLVAKLSASQKSEFTDVFKMIDTSRDGLISLGELKRALITTGSDDHTDEEILDMINKADPSVDGNASITYRDFMGVMAEAEFYHLFRDTFSSLDKYDSGFVRASDLDRVLCGVRDLISDDRKSIIDVEDTEMMIDYEHFSKMLLGTGFGEK